VVELGLKIASFTYGGLLGTFFLGLLTRRTTEADGIIGFSAGLLAMIAVLQWTTVDYTWHTLIGCIATVTAGNVSAFVRRRLT
jgi:SSS family solute:Na+ symporter